MSEVRNPRSIKRKAAIAAMCVGLTAGGYAVASAASNSSTSGTTSTAPAAPNAPYGGPDHGRFGPRGTPPAALTGDTLAKATAAATAKVPGATVDVAFADDHGKGAYVVLMTKADTSHVAVVLDSSFAVVAVRTRPEGRGRGPGGPDGKGGPGGRAGETALTGDTLAKVTAAAKAKVPGATLDRAETDADGNAKYEAHMTKADGTHVTVYVNAGFEAVSVETRPAGPPHGPGGYPGP
jgi:uncharacterized membrane protein YkoI